MEDLPVFLRNGSERSSKVSNKLDSCTTFRKDEIASLNCVRTTLSPGDVLFLPRRVVHSARALSTTMTGRVSNTRRRIRINKAAVGFAIKVAIATAMEIGTPPAAMKAATTGVGVAVTQAAMMDVTSISAGAPGAVTAAVISGKELLKYIRHAFVLFS